METTQRTTAAPVGEAVCKIRELTNESMEFYDLIGPFLARRAIARELGGPLWDDDGMRWFVALVPHPASLDSDVIGFGTLRQVGNVLWLDNTYVLPAWRGHGVYRQLLAARLAQCPEGTVVRALTTEISAPILLRRGFAIRRYRGRWPEMELTIGQRTATGERDQHE